MEKMIGTSHGFSLISFCMLGLFILPLNSTKKTFSVILCKNKEKWIKAFQLPNYFFDYIQCCLSLLFFFFLVVFCLIIMCCVDMKS